MGKKLYNSQLTSLATYHLVVKEFLSLAENVLIFPDMLTSVSKRLLNCKLVRKGSIAFVNDEVMGLLAIEYTELKKRDFDDKITEISIELDNGYRRILEEKDFVIMYDNLSHRPIYSDVLQYAERYAHSIRTSDININQQKTPRAWKTSQEKEKSVIDAINKIDSFEDVIVSYENLDLEDTSIILQPAPFVADKVDEHANRIYNAFLAKIGVASLTVQKKERNIEDEISASLGGTIANRYSRFTARSDALQEIKEKFGYDLHVEFYDGLPTNFKNTEKGDIKNVV